MMIVARCLAIISSMSQAPRDAGEKEICGIFVFNFIEIKMEFLNQSHIVSSQESKRGVRRVQSNASPLLSRGVIEESSHPRYLLVRRLLRRSKKPAKTTRNRDIQQSQECSSLIPTTQFLSRTLTKISRVISSGYGNSLKEEIIVGLRAILITNSPQMVLILV